MITDRVFAFAFDEVGGTSYLDIGVIRDAAMTNPADLVWLDVLDNNFWWMNEVAGVRIDGDGYGFE